ncbi:MAG TPA: class I SAM-dependent methyltransferase [Planctomycetota bacterium]|jgi:ubiquinone/menaquinone biosynthesis C-methylase UbiE|nr:hypothetical protein [Planctomycetota bacterium]MDP6128308.1 class I SAM-dependent methyltransferase [Planctomycetota bacterium]MDP7244978.1 class I SAM-dependent methyltransferase [Planctomycetota bacterium]HJM40055.1 class I SAM-dependent methyltransferase [Planctomycetota bacterium]
MVPRPEKLTTYRSEEVARDYDQRWSGLNGRRRDARKGAVLLKALASLSEQTGETVHSVLDVPCGTARFAERLTKHGYAWTGADLSLPMLQHGKSKTECQRSLCADLAKLPFPDQSFDSVVCIRFLHLVRDSDLRLAFLRELHRVARLGVVTGWHHSHSFRVWGRILRHRAGLRKKSPSNPPPARIRAELQLAGFENSTWLPVRQIPWTSDKVLVLSQSS